MDLPLHRVAKEDEDFGVSISLNESGETIVIGSCKFENSNGNNAGRVRVFDLQDDTWVQRGNDIGNSASYFSSSGDYFGFSTSVSDNGNILVAGASDGEYARVFQWKSGIICGV